MASDTFLSYSESLEESLADNGYLSGEKARRYAALLKLARSLAAKMDDLEEHGWLNAADRPDTTTATQYLKVLETLKLAPPAVERADGRQSDHRAPRAAREPLAAFRAKSFKVV